MLFTNLKFQDSFLQHKLNATRFCLVLNRLVLSSVLPRASSEVMHRAFLPFACIVGKGSLDPKEFALLISYRKDH